MENKAVPRPHSGQSPSASLLTDHPVSLFTVNKTDFPGGTTTQSIYILSSGTVIDEETIYAPPLHGVQREFVRSWDGVHLFKEVELADVDSRYAMSSTAPQSPAFIGLLPTYSDSTTKPAKCLVIFNGSPSQ